MAPRPSKTAASGHSSFKRKARTRRAAPREPSPGHPGAAIGSLLARRGLSESATARALKCSLRSINQIICGRRALTVDMACRLGRLLDLAPHDWLRAQVDHDVWHWHHRPAAKRSQRKRRSRPAARLLVLPRSDPPELQAEG